jgi:acetyl-CoA C-acetyltransferase
MTPNSTLRRVAIVGGNRIPFARSNTAYSRAFNLDMLTATLQGLVDMASAWATWPQAR